MTNISFRSLLVIAFTLGFYTNILVYLTKMGFTSIAPFYFMIFFGVISVYIIMPPFLIKHQIPGYFSIPVICWILFYLLISTIWFIPSDMSEIVISIFLKRILALLAFSVFLFIFSGSENLQTWARWTLLLAVCLAIFNNIYEFLVPFSFVSTFHENANPGRSAGFYINANLSGSALVLGMIFTVGLFPQKYRGVYVLSILLGVLLTFSRGSLVEWFIVVLVFIKVHILRKRVFLFMILGFGFLLYILLPHYLDFINGQEGINITNITERLNWIHNPIRLEDSSASERTYIANLSWRMFMDSPFWGNGIGSARTWSASTHNMYLYFMVDHGLIGFFILPLFAISVIWKARGEAKQIALPFLVFIMFEGCVTHNVIGQYYLLIGFALMAAMTHQSRFNNNKLI